MKLLRHGPVGSERPGFLDEAGEIRDLSASVRDFTPEFLARGGIAELHGMAQHQCPKVASGTRVGPPVAGVGKFIAIGLNYRDHAAEAQIPIPQEPIVFSKATSSIIGAYDDVVLPRSSTKTDWEVELGVVIGATTRYIEEADALSSVAGYCVVNDLSEREFQLERGGTWDKGKGCDTFGPIGPYLVTADEIDDPQSLAMWLDVNGQRRQTGHTSNMIFSVAHLVSYVSRFMTLCPGDVLTTGTPPGVGMGLRPQTYLKAGDVVSLGIEKLGSQRQCVRSSPG
jgi:2,4-didehydro-3-deoxy-L-rhamnonate hydrolase